MEKLILCAFNLRVFLQQVICFVISFIYEDLGNVYRRHICKTCEKFGIKAIRKKRYLILSEKMRDFCKFPDFRRELILSELPSSFVVDMVHIAIEESCLLQSDIELIAVNRNFSETEAERLQKFKYKLLLYDFKNKKEIIKIFYKNSDFGEKDDAISQKLIEIFSDDLDFICWLASKGSSPVLKKLL